MKACVLEAVNKLVYKEVPTPRPAAGEVLLKIHAAGICGSDVDRVYKKGTYSFPTIPGHEFAGEITELGAGVDPSFMGKKAAVFPLLPCRKCDMCEIGNYASCRHYNYFGSRCDGGFAEYISVPLWNLVMTDAPLSFEEMAMVEPAAVSLHALERAGVSFMDSVAVFGAGAIGLMLCEFASAMGAGNIIILDVDPRKIDFAQSMGYTAINNSQDGWAERVMELTHGKGVDLCVEGAGFPTSAEGCLEIAKPGGNVVLMGNPAKDMNLSQHKYWEILRKQLTVKGTWNSSYTQAKNDWQSAINGMATGKLNVGKFITHRFSLAECNTAFDILKNKTEFANRVMFVNS